MGVIYIVPFIVTSWTFHENPGVPLVIATIGSSIGQFIIPYLFEIFIAEYGWPGAFQLIGGITLNSLPFCVIVYTSRRFYVTGNEETSILKLCDVTLLKDPMVLFILSCCLNIALTGKTIYISNCFISKTCIYSLLCILPTKIIESLLNAIEEFK